MVIPVIFTSIFLKVFIQILWMFCKVLLNIPSGLSGDVSHMNRNLCKWKPVWKPYGVRDKTVGGQTDNSSALCYFSLLLRSSSIIAAFQLLTCFFYQCFSLNRKCTWCGTVLSSDTSSAGVINWNVASSNWTLSLSCNQHFTFFNTERHYIL